MVPFHGFIPQSCGHAGPGGGGVSGVVGVRWKDEIIFRQSAFGFVQDLAGDRATRGE
jgi:hypothetical protein